MRKLIFCALVLIATFLFSIANADDGVLSVGDVITFGAYKQSNSPFGNAEPIEWIVLECYPEDGVCLVVSRYVLDSGAYQINGEDTTWERCDMRAWLNTTFLSTAFDAAQLQAIVLAPVTTLNGDELGSYTSTQDYVFLLSHGEVILYFTDNELASVEATKAASVKGALNENTRQVTWWLRDMMDTDGAYCVSSGYGYVYGLNVQNHAGIRPAMWLLIDMVLQVAE